MGFLLSNLNKSLNLLNEREIDAFARLSTVLPGKRCVFIANRKYIGDIDDTVGMVITTEEIKDVLLSNGAKCGFCISDQPRNTYFDLMINFERDKTEYSPTVIGRNCSISRLASVSKMGVTIGDNVVIDDFVQILPNTVIGSNTVIQSGVVIGAQLFNTYYHDGKYVTIPQNGRILIGDNVLVGCNSVIAQAMYIYGETVIKDGAKIDANVSISHNDIIGGNSTICAGVTLGGYVEVGNNSEIGLGSTVKNAVKIGNNSMVGMGSVVLFDVKDDESCFGNPARKMK